ncbi:MAG: hypothetical protein ACYC6O_05355 [Thermoleophilia bacterium]
MAGSEGKYDRATLLAAVQIIFGIVIFSSSWWLSADQAKGSALYIFGFMTVLLGIVTGIFLSSRRS